MKSQIRLISFYAILVVGFYFAFGSGFGFLFDNSLKITPFTDPLTISIDSDTLILAPDEPIPNDPQLRHGTLSNGLQYYVRHNSLPAQRAELKLVVNVGSVNESDEQRGVAHFVEHMLFNGTTHFPHNELDTFLRSIGMESGADVNAHTSLQYTTYELHIPTESSEQIQQSLDIIADWTGDALFAPEEVEQERNVIVEEWRLRNESHSGRIALQRWPILMDKTPFAHRLPIGSMDTIRTVSAEQLHDFYKSWYQPKRMALIAVGDFDIDWMEEKVKSKFGQIKGEQTHTDTLPAPFQTPQTGSSETETITAPRYEVMVDKEANFGKIEMIAFLKGENYRTLRDFRNGMITDMFVDILNERLRLLSGAQESPFTSGGANVNSIIRSWDSISAIAEVRKEKLKEGTFTFFSELERVQQFGVTKTELERARKELLRSYTESYSTTVRIYSASFVNEFQANFLHEMMIPANALKLRLVEELLPQISLGDVNERGKEIVRLDQRLLMLTTPASVLKTAPTVADLATIYGNAQQQRLYPYEERSNASELLYTLPDAQEIVAEQTVEKLGVTELKLNNGIRVLLKPLDNQTNQLYLLGSKPGGLARLTDADYLEGLLLEDVINYAGAGDMDGAEVVRRLAGKSAWVSPYLGDGYDNIYGEASTTDVESMFQLLYLFVRSPFFFTEAYEAMETDWEGKLDDAAKDPQHQVDDLLSTLVNGKGIRFHNPTLSQIQNIDQNRLEEIYTEHIGDISGSTFIIAGDFDVTQVRDFVSRYIGGLPASADTEDLELEGEAIEIKEVTEREIFWGDDNKSIVQFNWMGSFDGSAKTQAEIEALSSILTIYLNEEVREKLGGSYDIYAYANTYLVPQPAYEFSINFACEPNRAEELAQATLAIVNRLRSEEIPAAIVQQVIEQEKRNHEESLEDSWWWARQIDYYMNTPSRTADDFDDTYNAYQSIAPEALQKSAIRNLPLDKYIRIILYPKIYKTASTDQK